MNEPETQAIIHPRGKSWHRKDAATRKSKLGALNVSTCENRRDTNTTTCVEKVGQPLGVFPRTWIDSTSVDPGRLPFKWIRDRRRETALGSHPASQDNH